MEEYEFEDFLIDNDSLSFLERVNKDQIGVDFQKILFLQSSVFVLSDKK